MNKYNMDIIDGKEVPPMIITDDHQLIEAHQGSVHVESGKLIISGKLQGSLTVYSGAEVIINGTQQGKVSVESNARLTVFGALQGDTTVYSGGRTLVEEGGKLSGTLNNHGAVVLRGIFGGTKSGNGDFIIEGNGIIKQPIIKNGLNYYQW